MRRGSNTAGGAPPTPPPPHTPPLPPLVQVRPVQGHHAALDRRARLALVLRDPAHGAGSRQERLPAGHHQGACPPAAAAAAPRHTPPPLSPIPFSPGAPLQVFFRAGKLAFLDELTGSEYKELAPDIANKVRIWLIKKRWRRHTIAVVAFLRLKRTLADLRLVRKLYSAASFMVLMANRPMLSLKRAREIRRRNAATKLQSHARAFVGANRHHQMKWAAFLLQVTRRHRQME